MSKYVGQFCTSCRNAFSAEDDIVVCPECGSPYHRECYKNEGRCVNTILHESGESWKPEYVVTNDIDGNDEIKRVVCPICGTVNKSSDAKCSYCGCAVDTDNTRILHYEFKDKDPEDESDDDTPPFNVRMIGSDPDLDGNTIAEYSRFVGISAFSYIPKFEMIAKRKRLAFSISAFLFQELYFFYRKMLPEGLILLIINTVLSLPACLSILVQYGTITTLPFMEQPWFLTACDAFTVIAYLVKISCGFLGTTLYYRKAKRDIKNIKSTILEEEARNKAIVAKGGTSWGYVIGALLGSSVLLMSILLLLNNFAG